MHELTPPCAVLSQEEYLAALRALVISNGGDAKMVDRIPNAVHADLSFQSSIPVPAWRQAKYCPAHRVNTLSYLACVRPYSCTYGYSYTYAYALP